MKSFHCASDTGEEALGMMDDFLRAPLPIVNNKQLLGLISEDDIQLRRREAVGSYKSPSMVRPYANRKDHIYELLRLLANSTSLLSRLLMKKTTTLGRYPGGAPYAFCPNGSFSEPGSILVLEMSKRDYSLAEIARIVESESAAILSSFITTNLESTG